MPLARAAMYAQGVDIWLAPTWDRGEVWLATLRHIGKEGRVHVVGVGHCLNGSDVTNGIEGRDQLYGGDDDWLDDGWSAIVDHTGAVLAGPLVKEQGILYADLDVEAARASRREFDPVGHYSRPDVFSLRVNQGEMRSVVLEESRTEPVRDVTAGRVNGSKSRRRHPSTKIARTSRAGGKP